MTDIAPPKPRSQTIAEARAAAAIQKRQQSAGTSESQSATGTSITRTSETASSMVAAHAEAMAKARFFVALQRPRDLEVVRERLVTACADPLFAEDATYQLKRWDAKEQKERLIEGFSARFAEAARTALGNIDVETTVLLDDEEKLIVQVVVTDLESNVTERVPIVVRKRIERRRLNKGQVPIATRTGADGQTIYIVAATDDEVQMRLNSAQSKATRNAVLRLLRADIRQECWDQVVASQRMAAQQDGATAKYVARFRDLGVTEQQLAEFFGRENVGQLSPDELQELNGIGRAIRDGEATWAEIMESRGVSDPEAAESKPAADAKAKAPTEREQLIAKVREAAALKLIQWDDIQSQTVRLCGGNPPQAWEKLTSLQAHKLWQWLEHIAKTEATQGGATS